MRPLARRRFNAAKLFQDLLGLVVALAWIFPVYLMLL